MVRAAFGQQAEACEALGSSFTASLCRAFGKNLSPETALGSLCLGWVGDPRPSGDSVPLRLCGGMHALVLSERSKELALHYPPNSEELVSWEIIERALREHEDFLLDWMKSPPQTNEVSRSSVLWPSLMVIADLTKLPLALMEVGASAGLNLNLDRFHYSLGKLDTGNANSLLHLKPEWTGTPAIDSNVDIQSRVGCDISPIDIKDPAQVLRLRSYVWPDQADRKARLDAALEIAMANPAVVEKRDAVEWLKARMALVEEGQCSVIYSTIAWQYLPPEARRNGEAVIRKAADMATSDAPIAWLRFEADEETPGAGIRLQLWPQEIDVQLGRGDFHGRWVNWTY